MVGWQGGIASEGRRYHEWEVVGVVLGLFVVFVGRVGV